MILSRRCRDYNTQRKKAEGKGSEKREEGRGPVRARAHQRWRRRSSLHARAHLLVVVAQRGPPQRREQGPDVAGWRGLEARSKTSCQDSLQAWKLLPSRRGCVFGYQSTTIHILTCTTVSKGGDGVLLPFTICLCLFSQLLGWSFLCRTTWLLCSRLVRSYHAVEIMAFSRWRFLMICSWAACGKGKRPVSASRTQHTRDHLSRGEATGY